MKKEIKYFLHTFFYFNSIEKKGLLSLFILVLSSYVFSYALEYWLMKKNPIELRWEKIQWISDSTDQVNHKHLNVYKNKFDSFQKYKNVSLANQDSSKRKSTYLIKYPLDLNTADSSDLVALPRIGPFLAGKIVEYRRKLGAFYSVEQLTEIWSFKEDYLYDLTGKIWVDPKNFKPIYINRIGVEELKMHPYFKYTLSKAIINYRNQHGYFKKMDELKEIKIINDSILLLIKPYISLE